MEGEIFYLCDPEKNVKCRKTGCYINAHRMTSMKCEMTKNPDYAKTNEKGEKIIRLVKKKTGDGDSETYQFPDMSDD